MELQVIELLKDNETNLNQNTEPLTRISITCILW